LFAQQEDYNEKQFVAFRDAGRRRDNDRDGLDRLRRKGHTGTSRYAASSGTCR